MKGRHFKYSADELAWIEARKMLTRRELHAQFVAQFQRSDVKLEDIKSLCTRKGWLTGRDGRIKPGATPPNKGMKMPPGSMHPNSVATRFKKGIVPKNRQPMGYERTDSKDGYIYIKVDIRNPHTGHRGHFVQKHRWLWEQANGPVPAGQIKELARMAYKTGYENGVEDAEGVFCRQACEEGWRQYHEELETAENSEAGWLIEDRSNGMHSLYMAMADVQFGRTKDKQLRRFEFEEYLSPVSFTKDANEAIRFARKEDAETFVRVFKRFMLVPEVTEHAWSSYNRPAGSQSDYGAAKSITGQG